MASLSLPPTTLKQKSKDIQKYSGLGYIESLHKITLQVKAGWFAGNIHRSKKISTKKI